MIQSGLLVTQAEEDVMVDESVAAIAAIERSDQIVLILDVDIVGADHSQRVAEPIDGFAEARRHQNAMTNAFDVRRPFG